MDIRNLEQIQERDNGYETRRLVPWLLASAGAGAIALTIALSLPQKHATAAASADPLGALIAQVKAQRPQPADVLKPQNASFAQMLSDRERPSTAWVAVRAGNGKLIPADSPKPKATAPWTGKQLPLVPLPAGKILDATAVAAKPADPLLTLAADRSKISNTAPLADAGTGGQFQIQVASFRTEKEAEHYTRELRVRGYKAYSQAARVPNRGLWHRVRIGPFKNKYRAVRFKKKFERKERVATLLVDPNKVERQRSRRAAKLAARARRKKRRAKKR